MTLTKVFLLLVSTFYCVFCDQSKFRSYNEWCQTRKMTTEISYPGCETEYIKNNYCYGQCNSYYLPSALPENRINGGRPTFLCHVCAPSKMRLKKVFLNCPKLNKRKRRRVEIVEECRCIPNLSQHCQNL
uniref:CTCK domain-containing protein n=1 Tax=Clytia hemisphaerica TaxID=252671 RepID=A0A7M5XCJ0_9CNID